MDSSRAEERGGEVATPICHAAAGRIRSLAFLTFLLLMLLPVVSPAIASESTKDDRAGIAVTRGIGQGVLVPVSESDAFFIPDLQRGMIGLNALNEFAPAQVISKDGVVLYVDAHGPARAWATVLHDDDLHASLLERDEHGWTEQRQPFRSKAINFASSHSALFGWRVDALESGAHETLVERVSSTGKVDRKRFSGFGVALMPFRGRDGFVLLATERSHAVLRYRGVQALDEELGAILDFEQDSEVGEWFAFRTSEGWRLILNDGSDIKVGGRPIQVGRERNGEPLWMIIRTDESHTAVELARSGSRGGRSARIATPTTGLAWLDPQSSQLASLSWENQGWSLRVRSAADADGSGRQVALMGAFATPKNAALSFNDGSLHGLWKWGDGRLDWIDVSGTETGSAHSLELDVVEVHPLRFGTDALVETREDIWLVRTTGAGLQRLGPVPFSIEDLPFGPRHVWLKGSVLWAQGWSSVLALRPVTDGHAAVIHEGKRSSPDGVVELGTDQQSVTMRVAPRASTFFHHPSGDDDGHPRGALSRLPGNTDISKATRALEQPDVTLQAWLQHEDGLRTTLESQPTEDATEWTLRPMGRWAGFNDASLHYVWRDAAGNVVQGVVPIAVVDGTHGVVRLWLSLPSVLRGIVYGAAFGAIFIGVARLLVSGGVGRSFIGWIAALSIPGLGAVLNESVSQVGATTFTAVLAFIAVIACVGALIPKMRTTLCDTQPFAAFVPVMLLSERFRRSVLAPAVHAASERARSLPGIRDRELPVISVPLSIRHGHSDPQLEAKPVEFIVAQAFARRRSGVVVLEGHGGTGKSTLMRESILAALGRGPSEGEDSANSHGAYDGWNLPVVISVPDEPAETRSLAVLVRESLMRSLPGSIVDVLMDRGELTVCIDGAESWREELLKTWSDRGTGGLSFLVATRVFSGSSVFRGLDDTKPSDTVIVYTDDWDEATLSEFLREAGKDLSKRLLDTCRRDGRYSPLLAAIALQVPQAEFADSKDQLYSRAIQHFLGNSPADPVLALREVSRWAFDHYRITGTRVFRTDTLLSSFDGIRKSALLIEDAESGLLRFIHDDLLAYVVCHHLRSLRSDEWVAVLERFLRSPAFHDAPLGKERPSSQVAMCCSVLTPVADLSHALLEVAKRWRRDHGDDLTLSQVSPLRGGGRRSGAPGDILIEMARSEAESGDMTSLAAYLEHVARRPPGLSELEEVDAT